MLVFWFGAIAGIVAFFIAVEIHDLISIMLFLFFISVNDIIASGQGFF